MKTIFSVEEIVERILSTNKEKIFVGIHAPNPHHGKSYVAGKVTSALWQASRVWSSTINGPEISEEMDRYVLDNNSVILIHNGLPGYHPDLVDRYVKPVNNNQPTDFHVFVYNPMLGGRQDVELFPVPPEYMVLNLGSKIK